MPEATALLLYPLATAMALIVVVAVKFIAAQAGEDVVGVLPSVVQYSVAPAVASENVTPTLAA